MSGLLHREKWEMEVERGGGVWWWGGVMVVVGAHGEEGSPAA